MRKLCLILGGCLVGVLVLLFFSLREEEGGEELRLEGEVEEGGREVSGDLSVLWQAPFAQEFGKELVSEERELELIQLAFQDYLSIVKRGYRRPIGDNRDFVEQLTGGNAYRVAPIPPDHPRIDGMGRLLDRRGVPYVIHPLSAEEIEVRAAGADEQVWTDDDLINVPVR